MEGTNGRRQHFTVIVTTTPKLIVGAGSRQAVTFVGGAVDVYLVCNDAGFRNRCERLWP